MKHKPRLSHTIKKNQIFDANYVFIDGPNTSGKSSIAPIISSFKRTEHYIMNHSYNQFIMLYKSGDLNKQGFKYLFEGELKKDVWYRMMGREMNTNLHDISSILNSPWRKKYIARANRKDTHNSFNEIIQEVNKKKLIFPFMGGDDLSTLGSVLNEINEKFKYIIVLRHPLELVFSYFLSGRTARLGTDPRYNKPAFKIKKFENIPHRMLDMPKQYTSASLIEKSFLVIENQLTAYMNSDLLHSKNTCLVPFENYCVETKKYIKIFENFLGTNRTKFTNKEMINTNFPRKKDNNTFSKKTNIIFDNMSDKYVRRLKNLCERYEAEISDVYKLSSIKNYSKGKFKGVNIDVYSQASDKKYLKGKFKNFTVNALS
jgi:hypothetical protein